MTKNENKLTIRKRSKSYTPTPLSPGDIREIPTSPQSPLRDRPLPPRLSKSLPGTPLDNSYQTSILIPTSPTISEEYESDSEAEEVFYTTIINSYEREQIEHKKEISNLHKEVVRLEQQLAQTQTQAEEKEKTSHNKLQIANQKLFQATKENKLLQKENEQVHLESKLISSDYLTATNEIQRLTERLNKEVENSKSLIAQLEKQ